MSSTMEASNSRKKVFLIHTNDCSKVQGSTEVHHITKYLRNKSDLHVFAPNTGPIDEAVTHSLPINGLSGVIFLNLLLAPYWIYQLLSEKPDIIYCYENVILPPLLGKWFIGATVAYDLRSDPYEQGKEFSDKIERGILFRLFLSIGKYSHRFSLNQAHYIYVLSEPLVESIQKNYRVPTDSIYLLPVGVDIDQFAPVDNPYDKISVVYVGALSPLRGITQVIRAISHLPEEVQQNVRLDLFGDGPDEFISKIVDKESERTQADIYWHGLIPHEELSRQAGRSDIAVSPLPPYEAYEVSSPAKIFEYMAMGLPIVASQITPHERILSNGENAFLYYPCDEYELSRILENIINNDNKRSHMGDNARSKAEEFSWQERFSVIGSTLF